MRSDRVIPFLLIYLSSFVCANLLVKHFGAYGLWFSSFFLIPFDFVARCYFQEKYKGIYLFGVIFTLIIASAYITLLINSESKMIAIASVAAFSFASIGATLYYQLLKEKTFFIKVNGSDILAICCDSIIFQFIAFHSFLLPVLIGQIIIKLIGGLLWYYILFEKIRIQDKF